MKRVVIESPYAGNVAANLEYAKRAVRDCLRRGEAPYASHLFFTQEGLLDDDKPDERALGMQAGFEWGCEADLVAVYVDRGISRGMTQGIRHYHGLGIPITCRTFDKQISLRPFGGEARILECEWCSQPCLAYRYLFGTELAAGAFLDLCDEHVGTLVHAC